jgi:hypothetical protein
VEPYLLFGGGSLPDHPGHDGPCDKVADWLKTADQPYAPSAWASAEYLVWWVKNGPLSVPLVTAGTAASQGVLGRPGTAILLDGNGFDYRAMSGGRFTLGLWHNEGQTIGIEGSGFFLEERPADFGANSTVTGTPLLARPLVNSLNGRETAQLISSPDAFAGGITVRSTPSLYGWEASLLGNFLRNENLSIDFLAGFRFVHLDEDVDISQLATLLPGGSAGFGGEVIRPPATLSILDRFATQNDFYGGQLGARADYNRGRLFVHLLGKVGLGSTHEVAFIGGSSRLNQPRRTAVLPGGVLALSSNIGRIAHDEFSAVPELSINVGCQVRPWLRLFAGYSLLYWTDVARPGDLISRTVNPTLIPTTQAFAIASGTAQPMSSLSRADFWAQGVNFGLEFRY